MSTSNPPANAKKFAVTLIISFVIVFIFSMLMMLWHGSYEKSSDGTMHYNTRINEPSSSY